MTLYEIDKIIADILENGFSVKVDEETGEVLEDHTAQDLDALQMERTEKLENVALYIKNLESLAEAIKAEENALKARREAREARANKLREYLTSSMTAAGEAGLETGKVCISFTKSSAVIVDEEKLDKTYLKETVSVTYKPDKLAIKKAIKCGQQVAGAYIEERKKVQIK